MPLPTTRSNPRKCKKNAELRVVGLLPRHLSANHGNFDTMKATSLRWLG